MGAVGNLLRRRAPTAAGGLWGLRRPAWWRVDLRVVTGEVLLRGKPGLPPGHVELVPFPPAAGPESELRVWVEATSGEAAERFALRVLERAGYSPPLAVRHQLQGPSR